MMPPILADATNSELGIWFQGLTFFVTLVAAVVVTWRALSNAPEKREISIAPDSASKHEVSELRVKTSGEVKDLHNKVERVQGEINKEIKQMNKEVGEISAQNEMQTQRIVQIDGKLDRLIERRAAH